MQDLQPNPTCANLYTITPIQKFIDPKILYINFYFNIIINILRINKFYIDNLKYKQTMTKHVKKFKFADLSLAFKVR